MDSAQVKSHNSKNDCWIMINGKVYDVTKYLDDHPGGADIIMNLSGGDATREFNDIGHSKNAVKLLDKFEIGVCTDYTLTGNETEVNWFQRLYAWVFPKSNVYLIDNENKSVKLLNRKVLTHDTIKLTFTIPGNMKLGTNCGQHIVCHNGDQQRKYTPTNTKEGEFELVVKVYADGKMSSHLNQMKVGDELFVSGPSGCHFYKGNGEFSSVNTTIVTNNILFICAGSGITPVYAILNQIANIDRDSIYTKLLFVNKTENDIILRTELDEMCNCNMKHYYALTQPPPDWNGLVGRPSKSMIAEIVDDERNEIVIICGSREFNSHISNICLEIGYHKDRIIAF